MQNGVKNMNDVNKHKAILWDALPEKAVQCNLCNFHCRIEPDKTGLCRVRQNFDGTLYSLNYHAICATNVDPIEKKPLFHFQPGRNSFSIGAAGCNFQCDFCQNWQISQYPRLNDALLGTSYTPEQIVSSARRHRCTSISYTYTEPTIFMELASECGRLAKEKGLANVFVSNGYMTTEAIDFARDFLDAINVDLKSFRDEFYRDLCKAKLQPVLDTLRYIAHQTDIWLEVTTLVVPGQNDSEEELKQIATFIADQLGPQVPWHVSRFHPCYERTGIPSTPPETLSLAYQCAREAGLRYIYVGNMPGFGHESTHCSRCTQLLIERNGYHIGRFNLLNGTCPDCGTSLAGKSLDPIQL